jgi:phospholipase C
LIGAPRRKSPVVLAVAVVALVGAACSSARSSPPTAPLVGIHKIQHVVVIMQENRSFDSYFGTYPGADGIPMRHGKPTVCSPDPMTKTCIAPFPDHADRNHAGPHGAIAAHRDIHHGKMDGFVTALQRASRHCRSVNSPGCAKTTNLRNGGEVMGYHTRRDIPNYWTYAHDFVLQDHMFEPNASWSLPEHLFQVSEWSALCTRVNHPLSCRNALQHPGQEGAAIGRFKPIYAWTDLTYLMHRQHVSWGYYIVKGTEPDCTNGDAISCSPVAQQARTPSIWNPLPNFDTVRNDHELGNIRSAGAFYDAARHGTLPAVSWIVPAEAVSEHPPSRISSGMAYVTSLINAVMRSPEWGSTAIFLAWDDWGGLYDHVRPPRVDINGYGLRVPSMLISPYAKTGYIDHQVLSFDAFNKFIEDDFLNGQRLDPKTDGRPDHRPTVRENVPLLGNLIKDFNFNQTPRPPLILPVHPKTTLTG